MEQIPKVERIFDHTSISVPCSWKFYSVHQCLCAPFPLSSNRFYISVLHAKLQYLQCSLLYVCYVCGCS